LLEGKRVLRFHVALGLAESGEKEYGMVQEIWSKIYGEEEEPPLSFFEGEGKGLGCRLQEDYTPVLLDHHQKPFDESYQGPSFFFIT
jgi:hypothetical protein